MSDSKRDTSNYASIIATGLMLAAFAFGLATNLTSKFKESKSNQERIEKKLDAVITHSNIKVSDD